MDVWAGFIIGLVGSVHCIGMCGPIVLALPSGNGTQLRMFISRILYNLGRVVTYSFLGAVFGLFGSRILLIGLQQNMSIFIGVVILLSVLLPHKIKAKFAQFKIYKEISGLVKSGFSKLLGKGSHTSFFTFGIINGFLPCGFVYVGIAGAVSTGSVLEGTIFMALFGLGTLPIMLATAIAGRQINATVKKRINRLIPALAAILAILFILRGLNLGIPYISPKLNSPVVDKEVICH